MAMNTPRRVVVTGIGLVTPCGDTVASFWQQLMEGRSGIRALHSELGPGKLDIAVGKVEGFDGVAHFGKVKVGLLSQNSQFALVATKAALADAKLDLETVDKDRVGVYLGSGIGGIDALEQSYVDLLVKQNPRTHPYTVIRTMANAAAGHISMDYGLRGPNVTISTACSSSAYAIGEAYRQIKHGYCDMMVAGGTEALLSFGVLNAWEAMRTTAPPDATDVTQSCRPFSKDRAGLVLGEGAGILILETLESARARGATIYAEVAGFGASSDAGHITKPSFEGQSVAMRRALQDAGLHPEDIDHVNAHGTATQVGDVEETKAIKNVFGAHAPRIAVSSTKSMHGHLMGATGAVEFIASVLAVKHQAVPATAHLRVPDPECDLDYVPNVGRAQAVRAAMSNSFAFGGSNAVLVAKAA